MGQVSRVKRKANEIENVAWIGSDQIIVCQTDSSLRILNSNFHLEKLQVHPKIGGELENERKLNLTSLLEISRNSEDLENWCAQKGKTSGLKFSLILRAWQENTWHRLDQWERVLILPKVFPSRLTISKHKNTT